MQKTRWALVCGAGGFIGGHLVKRLKREGLWVRGVDLKEHEFHKSEADEFVVGDLRDPQICRNVLDRPFDEVYQLAADMGGAGYIFTGEHDCDVMHNSGTINLNMVDLCAKAGVRKVFYSSSACIYPGYLQNSPDVTPLKEEDAYPADAEDGYGWEKLYSERQCRHYWEDYGLETRVVRFHNIYGPLGTYDGGREKSPAALCRKIALAEDGGEIEVWGDGEQTRSFCYIDDCVEGIYRLMRSDHREPLNLGSDRLVTINEMIDIISAAAGKTVRRRHDLAKPQGVRGRNSDNTRLREVLKWEPQVSLEDGLAETYRWIHGQLEAEGRISSQATSLA